MIAHRRLPTGSPVAGHPVASELLLRASAAAVVVVAILGLLPLMAGAAA
jgi:hypothetical protein